MNSLTLGTLHSLVEDRLRDPTITYLYNEYRNRGIDEHTLEIIAPIPTELREPVLHTFRAHVTKEKAPFAYALAMTFLESEYRAKSLASSVDLLWLLSLIYDDILDVDERRSGLASAWVTFGQDTTKAAAKAGFESILAKLTRDFGTAVSDLCKGLVSDSLKSIADHKTLTLQATRAKILENYALRSSFHDRFAVRVVFGDSDASKMKLALEGMRAVNLAGQILNDLKDFSSESWFGRDSFSDVRSGLVTLPVEILWECLSNKERERFLAVFGRGQISENDASVVGHSIQKYKVRERTVREALSWYEVFIDRMTHIINPLYLSYFNLWYEYKINQAQVLLAT
jgi:geranylgeranyl pyrophosphate synthase